MSYTNVEQEGPAGPEGKSAYQIWLELGNTGTEQDFIDSLKGEDGAPGNDGSNIVIPPSLLKLGSTDTTLNVNQGPPFVPIPFDTILIDKRGSVLDHSTSVGNTRIAVSETSCYRVTFNARLFSLTQRGAPQFSIRKNGTTLFSNDLVSHTYIRVGSGHSNSTANMSAIIELQAGDYIEIGNSDIDGNAGIIRLTGNTSVTVERVVIGYIESDSSGGTGTASELESYTVLASAGATSINIPFFDFSYLAFRGNIHLVKGAPSFGFTDNPGTGIDLTEPIQSGGEYISVIYKKT